MTGNLLQMASDPQLLEWMLDSDPALRWRVERDLVGASPEVWEATLARVNTEKFEVQPVAASAALPAVDRRAVAVAHVPLHARARVVGRRSGFWRDGCGLGRRLHRELASIGLPATLGRLSVTTVDEVHGETHDDHQQNGVDEGDRHPVEVVFTLCARLDGDSQRLVQGVA